MARPFKRKFVDFEPNVKYFKPRAVPLSELEEITLTHEEMEALRLVNIEDLDQTAAAEKMGVHQSTLQRTLKRARQKVTDALINGKAIKIQGGNYTMPGGDGTGPTGRRGIGRGAGRGMGRGAGQGYGGPQYCVCPKCGAKATHTRGTPCTCIKCPECGTSMVRD